MGLKQPKNWPAKRIYSPESVGVDCHIDLLRHALFLKKNQQMITPCIEEKSVHPHVEIREITHDLDYRGPRPHPLAGVKDEAGHPQYGVFATKNISREAAIGEYVGEIRLLSSSILNETSGFGYNFLVCWNNQNFLVINSEKIANEMLFVNDYRGLKDAPNVCVKWLVNRGFYYLGYAALRDIQNEEEVLVDYGSEWDEIYRKKYSKS